MQIWSGEDDLLSSYQFIGFFSQESTTPNMGPEPMIPRLRVACSLTEPARHPKLLTVLIS